MPCNSSDFDTIQDNNGYISYRFRNKTSLAPGSYFGYRLVVNLTNIPFDQSSKISDKILPQKVNFLKKWQNICRILFFIPKLISKFYLIFSFLISIQFE